MADNTENQFPSSNAPVTVTATPPLVETTTVSFSPAIIPLIPEEESRGQGSFQNPSSRGTNDLSDLRISRPDSAEVSPIQLPIRGEKRIVPSFVNIDSVQGQVDGGIAGQGIDPDVRSNFINYSDFVLHGAKSTFVDYVLVRVPHRGLNPNSGEVDPNLDAEFRFLINPATVNINRTTVDYQAFTRGGWQFGIWGEDIVRISMSGQTAGQYFSLGLTDAFFYYTESYRNLQQLTMVFENNGYWFEGEEAGEGPLAAEFTRRRIKMHQDVILIVGNFIWYGMFENLTVKQDAETPFSMNFDLTFVAWKERFRNGSPYWNNIENNVQRGHVFGANAAIGQTQINNQLAKNQPLPVTPTAVNPTIQGQIDAFGSSVAEASPALQSAVLEDNLPMLETTAQDFVPMPPVFFPSKFPKFWNQ